MNMKVYIKVFKFASERVGSLCNFLSHFLNCTVQATSFHCPAISHTHLSLISTRMKPIYLHQGFRTDFIFILQSISSPFVHCRSLPKNSASINILQKKKCRQVSTEIILVFKKLRQVSFSHSCGAINRLVHLLA